MAFDVFVRATTYAYYSVVSPVICILSIDFFVCDCFSDGVTGSSVSSPLGAPIKAKQAATSAASATQSANASAATSRLFENVRPPDGMASGAAAAGEAELPEGVGRVFSAIGNTLLLGGLATTAFFGYYTYRYTPDQLDTMVSETEKAENAFPGSQVWLSSTNHPCFRAVY